MNNANFYFVHVDRRFGKSYGELESKMDKALSWYRLTEFSWIVYSNKSPKELSERFASLVNNGGTLFISKLDESEREGLMDKRFWQWLQNPIGEEHEPKLAEKKFG
ncbi:MAG: hypothetical protein ORN98_07540 [Alphaproteobacteria bacterium]|nr:hypothetical protein [Alphaproteobacteria bacterium]